MIWHEAMFQQQPASLLDYLNASKAWPGSIKISLDSADYPPFNAPPAPIDHTSPIGAASNVQGVYTTAPAFYQNGSPLYKEGQASTPYVAPDGQTLYAHYGSSGLFNFWWWWTAAAKQALGS